MPTSEDLFNLEATLADLRNDSTFVKLFETAPPKIVFDDPRITNNNRIVAAFWPDENTISFRTGRTDAEAVRHEVYHAAQRFYLGANFCDSNNCETAAYEFEKMHPKVLFRMSPRYDRFKELWVK